MSALDTAWFVGEPALIADAAKRLDLPRFVGQVMAW